LLRCDPNGGLFLGQFAQAFFQHLGRALGLGQLRAQLVSRGFAQSQQRRQAEAELSHWFL
jgi:hypothetical protein